MKILIDANLSPRWVEVLTDAGFPAVHCFEVGLAEAPDRVVAEWAHKHNHVVLTNDLDFSAILAATHGEKPSVVQLRSDLLWPEALGQVVLRALAQAAVDLDVGAVVSVDALRTRVRILPLRR